MSARDVFDLLRTRDIPRMSRPAYLTELRHAWAWGVFAGLIEGNTASIVVAKTFAGSQLLVTVVWATPMLANVLSIVWAAWARGRAKLGAVCTLLGLSSLCAGSVLLTPTDSAWGGWLFAAQLAGARLFLAGVVTLRASIWKSNFPATRRARITGRLQKLWILLGLLTTAAATALFDAVPEAYRVVYPAAGAIGGVAILLLLGLRVRGETAQLADYRRRTETGRGASLGSNLRDALLVLRRDRVYAAYLSAQYCLGSANFITDPVLAIVVTKELGFGYLTSSVYLDLLPNVCVLATVTGWAVYFDRVGVIRFRQTHSLVWIFSFVGTAAALGTAAVSSHAHWPALLILLASRALCGAGRGGGRIAWNLGHLHFAGPHDAELYMGIHQALTGLRGITMPFVGLLLYQWIGWGAFAVAAGLAVLGEIQFRRLARRHPELSLARA